MPKTPKKYPSPLSIRFTQDQLDELERRAAGEPISTYAREQLLGIEPERRRRGKKIPGIVAKKLAQVLALLGQQRIANNLNQLARASNIGTFVTTPESKAQIVEACEHVRDVRTIVLDVQRELRQRGDW